MPLVVFFCLLYFVSPASTQDNSTQRITSCVCDPSDPQQSFSYPPAGGEGIVALGDRCWVVVKNDDCAWYGNSCLELGSCDGPNVPTFNISAGIGAGTVVFRFLTGIPEAQPNKACADYNKGKALLEAYVCYSYENKQQEFVELDNGGLQEK